MDIDLAVRDWRICHDWELELWGDGAKAEIREMAKRAIASFEPPPRVRTALDVFYDSMMNQQMYGQAAYFQAAYGRQQGDFNRDPYAQNPLGALMAGALGWR